MGKETCYSIVIPFVGGDENDTNYIYKNIFCWRPIFEDYRISTKSYSFKDLNYPTIKKWPKEIVEKLKERRFHFDPFLNKEESSYGEPLDSGKAKIILNFFRENLKQKERCFINNTKIKTKIFFGAKFQRYEEKGNNNADTALYLIGELDVKFGGKRDDLLKLKIKPSLRKTINKNAHQRRRKKDNFFIFIGNGFFYKHPKKFAEWKPYTKNNKRIKSYKIIKSFSDSMNELSRTRTSRHMSKFDRDLN